jgi:hypothetical protein
VWFFHEQIIAVVLSIETLLWKNRRLFHRLSVQVAIIITNLCDDWYQ